jgi:hypothetical protein
LETFVRMDWIPFRFSKNESLGYYEDLNVTFKTKACTHMLMVSWKTTKKGEFAGEDLTISWRFEANDIK